VSPSKDVVLRGYDAGGRDARAARRLPSSCAAAAVAIPPPARPRGLPSHALALSQSPAERETVRRRKGATCQSKERRGSRFEGGVAWVAFQEREVGRWGFGETVERIRWRERDDGWVPHVSIWRVDFS
jgi:hypothetical protein